MSETAGLFMQGFGTTYSAMGQKSAGKYAAQVAEYNAQVGEVRAGYADYNRQLAEYAATDAVARGDIAAGQHRKQTKALIGEQRAKLAAQGIDVNADSALDVQADSANLGAYDAEMIRSNAAREAWGYKVQAFNAKVQGYDYRVQAWNETTKGKMAEADANTKAMTTLLGGASNVAFGRYGTTGKKAPMYGEYGPV